MTARASEHSGQEVTPAVSQVLLLFPAGGAGVELRPGQRLYLGRHGGNDLVLDDESVSRFHAVLNWEPGAALPQVKDRGSLNGTRVDGVEARGGVTLRGGEVLRFGTVSCPVELRESAPEFDPALLDTGDETVLFSDCGGNFSDYAFDQAALHRALLDVEARARTGCFNAESEGQRAGLTFCLGRVVAAEAGELRGEAALRQLLGFKQAAYSFSRTFAPVEAELDVSLAERLKADGEGTRRMTKLFLVEEPEVEAEAVEEAGAAEPAGPSEAEASAVLSDELEFEIDLDSGAWFSFS